MAVAFILDFPGGTLDEYDRVVGEMDLGGVAAPGGLYHGAGAAAGGLRVIDVWEDEAAFDQFAASKIGPITQRHGLAQPQIERIAVAQVRPGSDPGERATFAQVVRLDGLDADGFAALDAQVVPDGQAPAGCVFHVNGPSDGGWVVVDYWTSRAARDAFIAERVMPVMQAAGRTEPPVFEDLDLHNTLAAASATAP